MTIFDNKINQAFVSVQAFLPNDKEIVRILSLCRFESANNDWTSWSDDIGNSIKFNKDRSLSLSIKDHIEYNNSTDIYTNSPPRFILEKSVWASIVYCEENSALIWLIGKDGRLRLLKYSKLAYTGPVPPITMSEMYVRLAVKQMDNPKISYTLGRAKKNWVIDLPITNSIILQLDKQNSTLTNKIFKEHGI